MPHLDDQVASMLTDVGLVRDHNEFFRQHVLTVYPGASDPFDRWVEDLEAVADGLRRHLSDAEGRA